MPLSLNYKNKPSLCPDIDPEVVDLCHALNCIPGIVTSESCSGHGRDTLKIFLYANDWKGLFFLTRCVDRRYSMDEWTLSASVGDRYPVEGLPDHECFYFVLESEELGEKAYQAAQRLIENFNGHLNLPTFHKYYKLDLSKFDLIEVDSD